MKPRFCFNFQPVSPSRLYSTSANTVTNLLIIYVISYFWNYTDFLLSILDKSNFYLNFAEWAARQGCSSISSLVLFLLKGKVMRLEKVGKFQMYIQRKHIKCERLQTKSEYFVFVNICQYLAVYSRYKFASRPIEKVGLDAVLSFLWNRETGEVMGRTGISWGE